MLKKEQGFTLIELTIVLSVIALLTTIVLSTKKSLQNAKTIAFIDQVQQYKTAYQNFNEKYGTPPGDLSSATSFFKDAISPGNGDGLMDYSSSATALPGPGGAESNAAWQHLKLAGLITGNFPGTSGGSQGLNYPVCDLLRDCSLNFSGVNIHAKMTDKQNYLSTNGLSSAQAIPVRKASAIDKKIDDGLPYNGWVNGYTETTDCTGDVDDVWSGNKENDTYNVNNSANNCGLIFALDRPSFTWN